MSDKFEIWEKPEEKEIYMLAGWRQWADGGGISSGLPQHLIKQTGARQIGKLNSEGFYLFQLPVTQYLFRPIVKHVQGYPEKLLMPQNELYYATVNGKGIVIFIGDEPHLNVEEYVQSFLEIANQLKVKRIVTFGGVHAEVPYEKDRLVHAIYSLPKLKQEVSDLVVNLSDYQGGASIGSYLCKRGGDQGVEVIGLYSFSPIFQFLNIDQISETIHVERDYKAWVDVMYRVNHMLGLDLDLGDLEARSEDLINNLEAKLNELDANYPELNLSEYMSRLSESFQEISFTPLGNVWEDELRRLGDEFFPPED